MAFAIALSAALAAVAFVLILLVGLVRHLKVLTRSLRTFQQEVQPLLAEIQLASTRAQSRLNGFDDRAGGKLAGRGSELPRTS